MTPSVAALNSESVAYDPGSLILHFQRLWEVGGLNVSCHLCGHEMNEILGAMHSLPRVRFVNGIQVNVNIYYLCITCGH